MIKELSDLQLENADHISVTVVTTDGTVYYRRDTTSKPFSDYENTVSFWEGDCLIVLPLSQVNEVKLHFGE